MIPYDAFKITAASIARLDTAEGAAHTATISCGFAGATGWLVSTKVNYPLTSTVSVDDDGVDGFCIAAPTPTSDTSTLPDDQTSYLVLRNFAPNQTGPISSVIPDYRLSCFEFQDFSDVDIATTIVSTDQLKYSVSITVEDKTIEVAAGLVSYYESVQELLAAYLDSADDDLSYNAFGEFNTFFSDGITSAYASAEEAPWNVAPVIYCIYQDLVYDLYDGDMDKITDAAQKIMDGIDPYVGNFFILETFKTAFDALYTAALSPTSDLGKLIVEYEDDETPTYVNTELTYEGEVAWDSGSSASDPDDIYNNVDPDDTSDTSPALVGAATGNDVTYYWGEDPVDSYTMLSDLSAMMGYEFFEENWPSWETDTSSDDYNTVVLIKADILNLLTDGAGDDFIEWTDQYLNADETALYTYQVRQDMTENTLYIVEYVY